MKKYLIAAASLMLFAGIINAQVAQKQPSKPTATKEVAYTKNNSGSKNVTTTASVSPSSKKTTTPNTEVKRKHHHKKTKTASTAGTK